MIIIPGKYLGSLVQPLLVMELDPEGTSLVLSVVDNSDILDVDVILRKKCCNLGKSSGLVIDLNMHDIGLADRTATGLDKGLSVLPCL